MPRFPKPVVVASQCLEFAPCRYDGEAVPFPLLREWAPHVRFLPVCPEVEVGLGVPRDPIRIVVGGDRPRLLQPSTGRDLTGEMDAFAQQFLSALEEVDGFILKSRSPSCGIRDAKMFAGAHARAALRKGAGLFAQRMMERRPGLAFEDESRLAHPPHRERFLTRLCTLAAFRELKGSPSPSRLARFHARNKLLLMSCNQQGRRALEKIAASSAGGIGSAGRSGGIGDIGPADVTSLAGAMEAYEAHLQRALARTARRPSNLKILSETLGQISKALEPKERGRLKRALERYRTGRVPLSVPRSALREEVRRLGIAGLEEQTFFEPYPASMTAPEGTEKE